MRAAAHRDEHRERIVLGDGAAARRRGTRRAPPGLLVLLAHEHAAERRGVLRGLLCAAADP
eukprot:3400399-Prymnesium_polylepis.1